MTLSELSDHADNVEALLAIKRRQLAHMTIDSYARKRHEEAITALEDRVTELRRGIAVLRDRDLPTLQLACVRPGVPPEIDMRLQPEALRDLPAPARDLCA